MRLHEEWLFKADNDLSSAEILINAPKPLYDIAVYHTQQCAEKALKAFLVYSEREIEKYHNLIILNNLCAEIDADFNALKESAIYLNPYSTLYRYPEGDLMPAKEEVVKAISVAAEVLAFVGKKIHS